MNPKIISRSTSARGLAIATLLIASMSSASAIARTRDLDGDGIPNGLDRDVDGDGIPNKKDRNVDGGVCLRGPFKGQYLGDRFSNNDPREKDIDGDGIPNAKDPDPNGDGKRDLMKLFPGKIIRKPVVVEEIKLPDPVVVTEVGTIDTSGSVGATGCLTLNGSGNIGSSNISSTIILGPGTSPASLIVLGDAVTDLNLDSPSASYFVASFAVSDPATVAEWLNSILSDVDRGLPTGVWDTVPWTIDDSSTDTTAPVDGRRLRDPGLSAGDATEIVEPEPPGAGGTPPG